METMWAFRTYLGHKSSIFFTKPSILQKICNIPTARYNTSSAEVETRELSFSEFLEFDLGLTEVQILKVQKKHPSFFFTAGEKAWSRNNIEDDIQRLQQVKMELEKRGISLGEIISRHSYLVYADMDYHILPCLNFFEKMKIQQWRIEKLVQHTPALLFVKDPSILRNRFIHAMEVLAVSEKEMKKILETKKGASMFLALKEETLERKVKKFCTIFNCCSKPILRNPTIIGNKPETWVKKKEFFLNKIGMSQDRLRQLVSAYPQIVTACPQNNIDPKINYLAYRLRVPREDVIERFISNPQFIIQYSLESRMMKRIDFLDANGILPSFDEVPRIIRVTDANFLSYVDAQINKNKRS